jgi:hypothetical protein
VSRPANTTTSLTHPPQSEQILNPVRPHVCCCLPTITPTLFTIRCCFCCCLTLNTTTITTTRCCTILSNPSIFIIIVVNLLPHALAGLLLLAPTIVLQSTQQTPTHGRH